LMLCWRWLIYLFGWIFYYLGFCLLWTFKSFVLSLMKTGSLLDLRMDL
jgi:hypothetical protein